MVPILGAQKTPFLLQGMLVMYAPQHTQQGI